MIRLSKIVNEGEEPKKFSNEVKKHFLEIVSTYNKYQEMMDRKSDIAEIAEVLGGITEAARELAVNESDDWFDAQTVKRNMSELAKLGGQFDKVAIEAKNLDQRLHGLYEDMGHILSRYYKIGEISEDQMKERLGLREMDNPCWKGYEMVGTKTKDGKEVPNCVPKNESIKESVDCGCNSVNEGKKAFKVNPGIGKAKYSISSHDGHKKHNDGSDFWDIQIFKNKVDLEKGIKDYKSKGFIEESVNEAFQKGKTYGGTKCEGGCFIGKQGLMKIIKISKESPKDVFMFRDDNYSGLQPHFIKDGVIAKATTINPSYDLEKHKVNNLKIGNDVILSVRLFVSTNESVNESLKHVIYVETPKEIVSKDVAKQILALAKKGVRSNEIGLNMGFMGNQKAAVDAFQKVKNQVYFSLDKMDEAGHGYSDSKASYIDKHKDEFKTAEKMNKGNEQSFYDSLSALEEKLGHPKYMIFLSNALRGYKVDMYKDPKIKNQQEAEEALFLLSK